jgi:hypothetical protein
MKFTLPTQHVLYCGIQPKKARLDTAGVSKAGSVNVAEIHNQVVMMLGDEIFDPEIGKRVLVDHAFMVAGGEITKAARNWLGNAQMCRREAKSSSWTATTSATSTSPRTFLFQAEPCRQAKPLTTTCPSNHRRTHATHANTLFDP